MKNENEGLSPNKINEIKEKIKKGGKPYLIVDNEDNSDEYINFLFIGKYEGKEVVYDAVIYTLRLHHNSEVYEIAEQKAMDRYPIFRKLKEEDETDDFSALGDLEEEVGLYMAEVIMDLEEEEAVKVQEHIEVDPEIEFGIGLDAGLNAETITDEVIENFVSKYNEGTLKLDKTLYSFEVQENDDSEE
ncbi:MAG: hypothetical protein M3512_01095 [Bacteroidota bacterium]|nr:hypothetical protein [Bacteroidota bacterium]